jgi:hypothetical protein
MQKKSTKGTIKLVQIAMILLHDTDFTLIGSNKFNEFHDFFFMLKTFLKRHFLNFQIFLTFLFSNPVDTNISIVLCTDTFTITNYQHVNSINTWDHLVCVCKKGI